MLLHKIMRLATICMLIMSSTFFAVTPKVTILPGDDNKITIELFLDLNKNNFIFKDYITIGSDSPDLIMDSWQSSIEPASFYDTATKTNKKIFNQPVTLTIHATRTDAQNHDAHLQMTYYENSDRTIKHVVIPVSVKQTEATNQTITYNDLPNATPTTQPLPVESKKENNQSSSWTHYIESLIKTNESYTLRLLLALLLGLLLSLTPCIYPMIPITIGILQTQGQTSILRNFLVASCYTIGVATTFALLGLLAAFTGQLFGSILASPLFVLCIILLLAYLAGSMIGWYELYIPRFLQNGPRITRGGSFLSAFLFGAISGTIASPCLSPGLLLLLTLVTTLHNTFLGFALLFAFGIGTSIPLLIIGTFSGSLRLLPQSGMWMIEIKKLFGFIMLGMCFYFLNTLIPWYITALLLALFCMSVGMYYLLDATKPNSTAKTIKKIGSLLCIIASMILVFESYKAYTIDKAVQSLWLTSYEESLEQAQAEHKKIFLDINAPFCSICKAIDRKILHSSQFEPLLHELVPVKINYVTTSIEAEKIRQEYSIIGVPTFLLLDSSGKEIKRWGSEIYDLSADAFVKEITGLIK